MLIARPSLSGRDGPLSYVLLNAGLLQVQTHVSGTPSDVPYPGVWNASAWTLPHEFLCYVVLGVAGSLFAGSALRLRTVTLGLWIGAVLVQAALPHTGLDLPLLKQFSLLAPLFFGGAVVAAFWSRPRPGVWVASLALVLSTVLVIVEPRIGAGLASPLITVTILWLGMRPAPALAMRHDISYGVYLYAFPVSQALAIVGLSEHFGAYALCIGVVALSLGSLSWLVVERPTQRWVKKRFSA